MSVLSRDFDHHPLLEARVLGRLQLEAELVDPLGERQSVLTFAGRDREEHRAHVGVGRDLRPRAEVAVGAGLGVRDRVQ